MDAMSSHLNLLEQCGGVWRIVESSYLHMIYLLRAQYFAHTTQASHLRPDVGPRAEFNGAGRVMPRLQRRGPGSASQGSCHACACGDRSAAAVTALGPGGLVGGGGGNRHMGRYSGPRCITPAPCGRRRDSRRLLSGDASRRPVDRAWRRGGGAAGPLGGCRRPPGGQAAAEAGGGVAAAAPRCLPEAGSAAP